MTRLKLLVAAGAAAAALAAPATVLADSCLNVSRAAPACNLDCTSGPVIEGNWVWLPSLGIPGVPAAWGFSPPGTPESVLNASAASHGNYLNVAKTTGGEAWLLENSARCRDQSKFVNHQMTHGIQSGCGQ
jgi:hypothetical protein